MSTWSHPIPARPAVPVDINAAHDTDSERETFVPARLSAQNLGTQFEPKGAAAAAVTPDSVSANLPARLSDTALKAAFGSPASVGTRMRRAAAAAFRRNAVESGVMTTPPTITTGTASLDATLTGNTQYTTSAATAAKFRILGGIPVATGVAGTVTAWSATRPTGGGGNTPFSPSKQTYHWAVEFVTDAPRVQIRHTGTSGTYMLKVDDQRVSTTALTHAASTGAIVYALLDFGTSAVRKIRVEYQLSSQFQSVDVGPTYSIWAPTDGLRIATVGDSIDGGTGATIAGYVWSKHLADLMGWADVRQVSYGGTGFINNAGTLNTFGSAQRVADAVAHAPDLLIVSASQNDDASTPTAITAAALAAFQAYRAALPTVPIVVMGAHAGSSGPSATRLANENAVKAAFDQWADSRSVWVPVSTDPSGPWEFGTGTAGGPTGTGNRDRFGFDASHPNDAGHLYLGRRAGQAFRAIVLNAVV